MSGSRNPYVELILRTPSEQETIICIDTQTQEVFYLRKSLYSSSEYLVKPKRDLSNVRCLYVSNISINIKPLDALPHVKQILEKYLREHFAKQIELILQHVTSEHVRPLIEQLRFIYIQEVTYTYCKCELEVKKETDSYQVVRPKVDLDSKIEVSAYRVSSCIDIRFSRKHAYYSICYLNEENVEDTYSLCSDCAIDREVIEKLLYIFENIAKNLPNAIAYRDEESTYKRRKVCARIKIVPEDQVAKLMQFLATEAKTGPKAESRVEALKQELAVPVTLAIPRDIYEKVVEVVPEDELKALLQEAVIDFLKQLFFYATDFPPVATPKNTMLIKSTKFRRENGNISVNVVYLPADLQDEEVFAEVYVNGELIYARNFKVYKTSRNKKYINVVVPKKAIKTSPVEIEVKVYRIVRK